MSRQSAKRVHALSLVSLSLSREAANDIVTDLDEITAEWERIYVRRITGKRFRVTVNVGVELVIEELVLAHTATRVEAWRVEVTEIVDHLETFYLSSSR